MYRQFLLFTTMRLSDRSIQDWGYESRGRLGLLLTGDIQRGFTGVSYCRSIACCFCLHTTIPDSIEFLREVVYKGEYYYAYSYRDIEQSYESA